MTSAFEPDAETEKAFRWILGFLSDGEWQRRRARIETRIKSMLQQSRGGVGEQSLRRMSVHEDRTAWYLYLVETSQHEPHLTEELQASRVLPTFKRLGHDLDLVRNIDGINDQITKFLSPSNSQPDSVLFEILIALLWSRNGFDVRFVPVAPPEKRPDIHASKNGVDWFIETKRLVTTSQYSEEERQNWLRIWKPVRDILVGAKYPLILDLTFHVELKELQTDFAANELKHKLQFVTSDCELISNDRWRVAVRPVDFPAIRDHFSKNYVKSSSRQMLELIGGEWDRTRNFTYLAESKQCVIGEGVGFNIYTEDVRWAAGAYWHCDAERAMEAKARDIRSHLSKAVKQLPDDERGVVQVGIEANDGEHVEMERYRRILNTNAAFDAGDKDLRWVFTHVFESYCPPSCQWVLDETIYKFQSAMDDGTDPLSIHAAINPDGEGEDGSDSVHWLRSPP